MSLLALKSNIKKKRKLLGRGNGSGHGTYCCKGGKGQTARSGGKRRPGFEGGQTPYSRKLPKLRGFKNPNKVNYQVATTDRLNVFENNATINKEDLLKKNIISKKYLPVKLLLGKGELEKTLTINVDKASLSAIKAVEDKKGKVILKEVKEKTPAKEKKEKKGKK
jgi:large subunit ribosomal protein L15